MLSRSRRKKQRREAEHDGQGEKALDDDPHHPPPVSTDVMDKLDPGVLYRHILDAVPVDQFEGAMQNLATDLPQAIAGKAYDRGIMDEAAGRAFVQGVTVAHGVSRASVGKVKVK